MSSPKGRVVAEESRLARDSHWHDPVSPWGTLWHYHVRTHWSHGPPVSQQRPLPFCLLDTSHHTVLRGASHPPTCSHKSGQCSFLPLSLRLWFISSFKSQRSTDEVTPNSLPLTLNSLDTKEKSYHLSNAFFRLPKQSFFLNFPSSCQVPIFPLSISLSILQFGPCYQILSLKLGHGRHFNPPNSTSRQA